VADAERHSIDFDRSKKKQRGGGEIKVDVGRCVEMTSSELISGRGDKMRLDSIPGLASNGSTILDEGNTKNNLILIALGSLG
jgi:hypothetical protein